MNTNDQLLVPKGWKVKLVETSDREGTVEISGPYVFHMEMPVRYSMFDFFKALAAQPGAVEPVAEIANLYGDPEAFAIRELKVLADIQNLPIGTKLFAHPPRDVAAGGVVLPERIDENEGCMDDCLYAMGWNACLDEVARLNGLDSKTTPQ